MMFAFQEVAAAHATQLELGFDDMMEDEHIWVLTKLRFKIYGDISENEGKYVLETYPRPKKGITFFRDYYLYREESMTDDDLENRERELVAAGTSQWCIINFKTRRIERTKVDFDGVCIDHEPFEEGIGKIKTPEMERVGSYVVTEDDLDVNQHLNNCRYADIMDRVVGYVDYNDFHIHFSKEATLGDEIVIYREAGAGENDKSSTVITGKLMDDTVIFLAEIANI